MIKLRIKSEFEQVVKDHHATIIQRYARGWLSRHFDFDMRRHKEYLAEIRDMNSRTRMRLLQRFEENLQIETQRIESTARDKAIWKASRQHHLVSTQTIPSVFKRPLKCSVKTFWGVDYEDLIKEQSLPV